MFLQDGIWNTILKLKLINFNSVQGTQYSLYTYEMGIAQGWTNATSLSPVTFDRWYSSLGSWH